MPTYTVTSKRTGKSYQMPWSGDQDPTEDDVSKYIYEQQRPKSTWEKLSTPLTELPSKVGRSIGEPLLQYGESHPGGMFSVPGFARGAGAFAESLGDVTSGLTSPVNLGLTALTAGSGLAGKLGATRVAQALNLPGRAAGVGMMGQGAYRVATEPTTSGKLSGGVEALLGGLGARSLRRPSLAESPPSLIESAPIPPQVTRTRFGVKPQLRLTGNISAPPVVEGQFHETPIRAPGEVQGQITGPPTPLQLGTKIPNIKEVGPSQTMFGSRRGISPDIEAVSEPTRFARTPEEASFNALVPERFKPHPSSMGTTSPYEPLVEERSGIKPTPKPAQETGGLKSNPIMAKMSEDDLKYLAETGDKEAILERGRRAGEIGAVKNPFVSPKADKVTETATRDWVNERKATREWGNQVKRQFSDLNDPELVDKYQAGDRSGRLADVQKFQDELFKREVKAGILDPEQYKENYFNQLWKDKAEDVQRVYTRLAQTPGFAKESSFDTFARGRAAGLTPKFDNIPDIMAARAASSKAAFANIKFRNYLIKTDQMHESSGLSSNPNQWGFQGPNGDFLKAKISNYLSPAKHWSQVAGEAGTFSKNLTLMGGTPGTTANIHGYNIARREVQAQGFIKGGRNALAGTFNPAEDEALIAKHRDLIPKLQEKGGQVYVEDHPEGVSAVPMGERIASMGKGGEAVVKGIGTAQKYLEYPLFGRHIPARYLELADEIYKKNLPKLGEDEALRKAASISNDFFGGVDNALRDKDYNNVLRATVVAPNWFQSNIALGVKGVKAMIGKEDPIYAKALARQVVMRLAKEAPIILAGKSVVEEYKKNRPTDATTFDLGQTASGKRRELSTTGTAGESTRLPEETIGKMIGGDIRAVADIAKNRLNPIARAPINIMQNRSSVGQPLAGKDDFGRPIPLTTAGLRVANELTQPFQPQQVQALTSYLLGGQGLEESINQGLEGPFKYSSPVRVGRTRRRSRSR